MQNASADLIYPNKSPLKSQVLVMAHIGKRKLWSIFWKKKTNTLDNNENSQQSLDDDVGACDHSVAR